MFSMGKLTFFIVSILCLAPIGQGYNLNAEFKLMGPSELTDFLVDRLGGLLSWNLSNWDQRSDSEVREIFAKHSLKNVIDVPCEDENCFKTYTDKASGEGKIISQLTYGNKTIDAQTELDGDSLVRLFFERDAKEEAHCLVASVNSTFENKGEGFDYTVVKNVTYGGGVKLKMIMEPEKNEEDGLIKLHIIRASSKSELQEITSSANYFDKKVKSTEVSATVVTFDTEKCDNSVENLDCNMLARVYHHIKSSDERTVTFKDKTKNYKADSYGTIITVVKKA